MPWVPFFSNCDGHDSRIIPFDAFEYAPYCELPAHDDIRIVNPIPSTGLDPIADKCNYTVVCRYDEPLDQTVSSSVRWYKIGEERDLFYITREPIPIENFVKKEEEQTSGKP